MGYRVGIGYDIHRLESGRKLFLGGVEIPHTKGLLGHSDGDALMHAICDALLGAAGLGDIGEHFPDTEAKYKDIASSDLLKTVAQMVDKNGFRINNIDTVIIAEEPKLGTFKDKIGLKISGILKIDPSYLGVKAKTSEGLGETGNKEAIVCWAVALISPKEEK